MKFLFYFITLFCFGNLNSQTLQKIKFQKNPNLIYFFSKNATLDSVIKDKGESFYLIVPDSLKKDISVFVENGQLIKTKNDSLVKLNYMSGLKYETQYIISEEPANTVSEKPVKHFNMISLINGTSVYPKNKIRVQITNKKEEKVIIENVFFYKN